MRENIEQIYQYAWKAWRWRWVALGTAAVVCAIGWAVVAKMPDKYESMARVFLETESILGGSTGDDIILDNEEVRKRIIDTSRKTLLSRPNLEKVARETDLDLEAHTPAEKERLIAGLKKQIEVTGDAKDSIYIIRYKNSDPILAKEVVESLLDIFSEDILGKIGQGGEGAKIFLDKQIKENEAKLLAAEDRLKNFKRLHVGQMPTESGGYFTRIQNAIDHLDKVKLDLNEAIQRKEALEFQLSNVPSSIGSDPIVTLLLEKISELERRRDALMLQYTNRHPDVIAIKQKIITLEKQKLEAELLNSKESNSVGVEDLISQELTVELGKVKAEVAGLIARKRDGERKVSGLKRLADTAPQVEADLLKLNRDYDDIKELYKNLVKRRLDLDITIEADDSQFKIIDPPVVPLVPAGPGRPVLMSLVLLAGLGVGIAFTVLLSQLRPTFDYTNELSSGTGFPVYGSISTVWKDSELSNKKSNFITFLLAVLALFVAYGVVVGIQVFS